MRDLKRGTTPRKSAPNEHGRAVTGIFAAVAFLVLLGVAPAARAQGSRKDDIVFNAQGRPMAGATVRICTSSATGEPCSPLANIYSDVGLTQALANPTATDGLGNYSFYASPGQYMVEISGPSITTKQIPNVILPNDPSAPTFATVTTTSGISAFSLSLSGNLTVTGSAAVTGALTAGGSPVATTALSNTWTAPQTFSSSVNVGQTGNVAAKNAVSDAACYVTTNGNDGNDGLSWGTAKLTIYGCLVALPGGSATTYSAGSGTIYLQSGSTAIGAGGAANSVLILGSNDPHWNNTLASCSRSGNVVTLTFGAPHNYLLSSNQQINVYGTTGGATSFSGNFTITGGTSTTLTYSQSGPSESCNPATGAVLPVGFIKESGSVNFIAKGSETPSNSPGATALPVSGGNGAPTSVPYATLQLSGTNSHYYSDGIDWHGCIPVALGVDSNYQQSSGASTFSTYFDHGAFTISFLQQTGCGPAMEIGRNVLWLQVKNSAFDALGQTFFNVSSLTRSANVTSVTLSAGPGTNGWQVGDQVAVAAFSDASYNGLFTIASVTDTTHFTYNNLGANCTSSCGSGAIVALGPQTNRRSAVLFNPNGGNSGLAYFENITSNGGGLRATSGVGQGSGLAIEHWEEEGSSNSQPIYECTTTPCPWAYVRDVGISDSGDQPPAVRVPTLGNAAEFTIVDCLFAPAPIAVQGPALVNGCQLQSSSAGSTSPNVSPAAMGQKGIFTSGFQAKAWLENDDLRRGGGPVSVRFPNLASTAPASWTNVTGGNLTITGGIADALGATGAANLHVTTGNGEADSYSGSRTVKAGDYFFAAVWMQASSAAGVNNNFFHNGPLQISFSNSGTIPRDIGPDGSTGNLMEANPISQDDGAWQWVEVWDSVNNNTTTAAETVKLKHFVNTTFPENLYAPILIHVPISTLSRYSATLSSVSSGGGFANYTTGSAHSFTVNQIVCINDVTDTTYNGCTTVLAVPSSTTFTTAYGGSSTSSTGGTAYASADSEAAEIGQSLTTYLNTCSVAQFCTINGPVAGGAFSTKSSAYTLAASDSWVNVTGTTTITVPHAIVGQRWVVFNSGSNTVTVQADSGNVNGASNITLAANTGKEITCDGSNCFAH